MADYHIHLTCVALSGLGFLLRGIWMMTESAMLQAKPVRILPHIIDTLLLLSALALAVITSQYPFVMPWLTVKLVLLLAYIGLGVFALRRGKTKSQRVMFFIAALAVFVFMISVAFSRSALGVFAMI